MYIYIYIYIIYIYIYHMYIYIYIYIYFKICHVEAEAYCKHTGQNSDNLQNLSGTNKIRAQDLSTRFVSSEQRL